MQLRGCFLACSWRALSQTATQHNVAQTVGFSPAQLSELCHNDLQQGRGGLVHWVGPLFIRSSHQCSFIQPGGTQAISGCKQLCNQHLWASNNQSLGNQSFLSHEYLPCNYWHDDRGNTSVSTNRLPSNYSSLRKSTTRLIKTIPLSSALEIFLHPSFNRFWWFHHSTSHFCAFCSSSLHLYKFFFSCIWQGQKSLITFCPEAALFPCDASNFQTSPSFFEHLNVFPTDSPLFLYIPVSWTLFSSMQCQHSVLSPRRRKISCQAVYPFRRDDWSFLFIIPSVEHLHRLMFISSFETRNWLCAHIRQKEAEQNGTRAGGELYHLAFQLNFFADI